MNYKGRWTKIALLSLVTLLGFIGVVSYAKVNATRVDNKLTQEKLNITSSVSKQLPVIISQVTATKIENEETVLKYLVTNETDDDFAKMGFVAFVTDKKGNIKAGQGWTVNKVLTARQSTEISVLLKQIVATEDSLILTVHKVEGQNKKFEIAPSKVLENLSEQNLVKPTVEFVKTSGIAVQTIPPSPCADGQKFAEKSCGCGIKTFSCNAQTGEYSFTCFTRAESPCGETPPDAE